MFQQINSVKQRNILIVKAESVIMVLLWTFQDTSEACLNVGAILKQWCCPNEVDGAQRPWEKSAPNWLTCGGVTTPHYPCVGRRLHRGHAETAVSVINSWRWYNLQQMRKTGSSHQHYSAHSEKQPQQLFHKSVLYLFFPLFTFCGENTKGVRSNKIDKK